MFETIFCTLICLFVYRVSTAPLSSSDTPNPICSSAQLIVPGSRSLVYKYTTEVKLSVGNGQFDLKNKITAEAHIKNLENCNYALQLRNVKISETKDESRSTVTSTASSQRELENLVVRFKWIDGFVAVVEADASAKVDHVNFIKGLLSALQVVSPVPTDGDNLIREEDVLGVCTTRYKYSSKGSVTVVNKFKDLSTCSKDKLHLSSSPVLTSLLGPMIEEVFSAKARYVCRTEIRDRKIQSVKCKTIEIDTEDSAEPTEKPLRTHEDNNDSSEEDEEIDFSEDDDDEEISPKLISIKQELQLQAGGSVSVDGNSVKNGIRQTLQFVPTTSFDKSNEAVSALVSKIQALLQTKAWTQFASASFVEITNALRRMNKTNLEAFKSRSDLKHLVSALLNTVYAHDPSASLLNLDSTTLKFANPLAIIYLDKPSTDLLNQILQGARRLNAAQVPDFVGPAATILKTYKAREDNNKDANTKIRDFQRSLSKFLSSPLLSDNVTIAVLSAYATLGLYDDQVRRLATDNQAAFKVQYHAFNAIRHISDDYIDEKNQLPIRTELQNILLRKVQNKNITNAVRIWAFEALYTPFIYNPEEDDATLAEDLEKTLTNILNEPLNQVNGFIWSALKYSSLDRLCPLRGLASRLRAHHDHKNQFAEQSILSSRQIQLDLPLRNDYRAVIHACVVFENDRVVPSFVSAQLAFDGIRRETLRLPWIDLALIIENLDWNFADYFLRLDPLNHNVSDDEKNRAKARLPPALRGLQDNHDQKNEDPDPSVHLYLKVFGADVRSSDVTKKVQEILRHDLRTYLRNELLNRLKDLVGKDPLFRVPLELGAVSAAANGLALYKSVQMGVLADLTTEVNDTRDSAGLGAFSLTSRSALSFSVTLQRELSSPLSSIGETIQFGGLSSVPFRYTVEATNEGQTREFNLLNTQSTLLSTDFRYSIRTSKGLQEIVNSKSASIDPSCTPSIVYRGLGLQACLELNPFRSIQFGSRPSYPLTITVSKDPLIKKWRLGWRFNASDAPQYEVAVEKVGTTGTYPGLGISATKTDNQFDIKVLTGMKSFSIKGTQTGNRFSGSIYSNENKEVMTTSGTLSIDNDGFKLDSKFVDIASKKEVLTFTTEILPNRGQGLTADIALTTANKANSYKVNLRGDLYKSNSKLFHITGTFNLGDTTYAGKVYLERNDNRTRIELHRLIKPNKNSGQNSYEFLYERQDNRGAAQNNYNIASHFSQRTPATNYNAVKLFDFKTDFTRTNDRVNTTLRSTLDFLLLTRNPPVTETIELDYVRRLISPKMNLKVQLKTKSNALDFLFDHRHRKSSEASKKGTETLPPTLDIVNKIHFVVDTDKLLPDIPRPVALDILSDLDFELLNKVNYKFEYDLRRRQRSGLFTYNSQVNRVTNNHLFSGTSKSELQWDNKQKKATATGSFVVCTQVRSLKTHWDVDTTLIPDRNDIQVDLFVRFDRQPKQDRPKSLIGAYNVTIKAPKHEAIQLIDLDGNVTRQRGSLVTSNSIAYRTNKTLKEINLNLIIDRNLTGDGSLHTHLALSLPFRNLPYITHDLILERADGDGRLTRAVTQLIAKPVLGVYSQIKIDRSDENHSAYVRITNEMEYLRANGVSLHGVSKIDIQRWATLHSFGFLRRNTDLLHRHSVGYIFTNKTRKVAVSLESPQSKANPLSMIGELTIDRENRIGKLQLPQEFGIHLEFGTPLTNLTALHLFYDLPLFHDQTVDGTIGFKVASPNIVPINLYLHATGSLNTTLQLTESFRIGDGLALNCLLTAQYDPQLISQISVSTSAHYDGQEFQNSLYALFKQHQVVVRGLLNTTDNQDFRYDMDIGFDDDLLSGHSESTDGKQLTVSDIDARKCSPSGKYNRCYKGDITVRTGNNTGGKKGTFDVSWGQGTARLEVQVPGQVQLKFDHTHSGRVRGDDFSSKTNLEGRSDRRGAFSYSGVLEKEDGKWNNVRLGSSLTDKNGQISFATNVSLTQEITNQRSGQFQRKINLTLAQKGQSAIVWSSESNSCLTNPSVVVYGICQTTKFDVKANHQLAQRLRQRLDLPSDPKLSNPTGHVTYNGTFKLDIKADPSTGPHTVKLDVNRWKEDAVDLDLSYQARYDHQPMNLRLTTKLPQQDQISIKYDETRRSQTNFQGVLKYSFNTNDSSAEKTYKCDVDRVDAQDFSVHCKGDRTTLTIDIDRKAGKSQAYLDLNGYTGERIGYEVIRNPQTEDLSATLYTLITSWNVQRRPDRSIVLVAKQKKQEVLRVEGTKVSDGKIEMKIPTANVNLNLEWDNSTLITLKQTFPQERNLATITIDRATIRRYLTSFRNLNQPSADIDQSSSNSRKPLVEIALDSQILLSLSQATDKLGSHNGLFGLDTIKKSFKLQIGDAPLTVYSTQHWKTHREDIQLPESYSVRIVNNIDGNLVQLSTNKWDEHRLVTEISHSFNGGRSLTSDLKLHRNYALQVGSIYFFRSVGSRNIQGVHQLRNFTRHFIRDHLTKNLNQSHLATLSQDLRKRIRSILDKDYAAAKDIVTSWNKEPENSFLRRLSTRLGLIDFFDKYPTYTEASEHLFAILREREQFWCNATDTILDYNRLQDLAEHVRVHRTALIKQLLNRAEKLLDRFLPTIDQVQVNKRLKEYVEKLITGFEQVSKQNTEQWKAVFKAIDDASQGEENRWFRTLVADIDSLAFATAVDAELAKVFKEVDEASNLVINTLQEISRGLTKRQENIRERVLNLIRHFPKASLNETKFELLFPLGPQPGSYAGTSEFMLGLGSLLRNRDRAVDTIRSIIQNRVQSHSETFSNYFKALRSLVKHVFKRHPSLIPECQAVLTQTGDALDLHGDYLYLNPACDYILAHDFADLQFSFTFANGKAYSLLPNREEIEGYECSNTTGVQLCNHGNYYTLNVPMYYGGRVDGVLGDVRDRSRRGHTNLTRWLSQPCSATTNAQPRREDSSIFECANDDENFCESYVQRGLQKGLDRRQLVTEARNQAISK